MLALAMVAILAQRQGIDTPVTYVTRAARAEVVLPELGKLAGVDLRASKETANEILVISVKATPLADILPRIATVTSSEWKHDGDTLRLVPNRDQRRKEDAQEANRRASEIQSNIALRHRNQAGAVEAIAGQEKEQAAKKNTKTQITQDGFDIAFEKRSLVLGELVTKLLEGIGASTLASTNDRTVFSTNPTGKQRPLGDDAAQAILDFIKAHNVLVPATTPVLDQDPDVAKIQQADYSRKIGPIGRVEKAILIKEAAGGEPELNPLACSLEFFDSKGKVIFESDSGMDPFALPPPDFLDDDAGKSSPQIPYTDDSREFLKGVGYAQGGTGWDAFPDSLLPKMVQPLVHDPLSYYQTDEVMAYAKSKGKPLVADLPDDWGADEISLLEKPEPLTLYDITKDLKDGKAATDVGDPQFTVVTPSRPPHSRAIRVDRHSIAKLVAAGDAKGVASFDDLYEFAAANSYIRPTGMMLSYLAAVVPPMEQFGQEGFLGLELYAELSRQQRDAAAQGVKIPLSSLSASQLAVLDRLVYRGGVNLQNPQDQSVIPAGFAGGPRDYRSEPTEVAPNGVPRDAYVEIHSFKSPLAFRVDPTGMHGTLSAFDIVHDTEPLPGQATGVPVKQSIGTVRLGEVTQFEFVLHMTKDALVACALGDYSVDKQSKAYALADLPADLAKQIAEMRQDYSGFKDTLSSQAKGVAIPP